MKALQVIGIALILVGGFWLGTQLGDLRSPTMPTIPRQDVTPLPQVTPIEPVVVPAQEPVTPAPTTPAEDDTTPDTETPTPTPTEPVTDPSLPNKVSANVNHYQNSNYKYGFDIPANLYYAGFAGQGGARHTVGIGKEDPETLADAAIRVYFYGKVVVPELTGVTGGKKVDPAGKYIYLLLDNAFSVKIEAANVNHPAVQKIVETIAVF